MVKTFGTAMKRRVLARETVFSHLRAVYLRKPKLAEGRSGCPVLKDSWKFNIQDGCLIGFDSLVTRTTKIHLTGGKQTEYKQGRSNIEGIFQFSNFQ